MAQPGSSDKLSIGARLLDDLLEASVVGSFTRIGPELRRRSQHWAPLEPRPDRLMVLTGASSGLGRAAAVELAGLGVEVIGVGRDRGRLDELVAEIADAGGWASAESCDLSDLEATAELAGRLRALGRRIDVLVHDAGALSAERQVGPQGFELTVAVQLLSPYLLTEQLRSSLSPQARVITMTSGGMYAEAFDVETLEMDEASYKGSVAYARAKRGQVLLTAAWQRREAPGGLSFHAVHPGWARTPGLAESLPGFNKALGPLLRSPAEGVDTLCWLATQPDGEPGGGRLWLDRRARPVHRFRRTRVDEATEAVQEAELLTWLSESTAPWRDEED